MSNRMPRVEVVSPARTATKKTEAGQAADDKPTLMLLDGNSLAFRAFYALPAENFKTQGGLTTNAVYGFTAMLINLLRDESPTHVAAAFDVSRQTFRSERRVNMEVADALALSAGGCGSIGGAFQRRALEKIAHLRHVNMTMHVDRFHTPPGNRYRRVLCALAWLLRLRRAIAVAGQQ